MTLERCLIKENVCLTLLSHNVVYKVSKKVLHKCNKNYYETLVLCVNYHILLISYVHFAYG